MREVVERLRRSVRRRMRWPTRGEALRAGAYVLAWLLIAVPVALLLFFTSSASTTLASHDATVRPTVDGYVTLRTGPFLPDVRAPSGGRVGVEITLGKTEARSTEELVERYAFIASQPDAQVARVQRVLTDLAYDAALRGAVIALVPPVVWALVGKRRRRELLARLDVRRSSGRLLIGVLLLALLAVLIVQPWKSRDPMLADSSNWRELEDYVPEVTIPAEASEIQVSTNSTTNSTKRLVLSAIDTFRKSKGFYQAAASAAGDLVLRQPEEGETVAVLVSDRHDNIGMDPVARAIADQAGATAILNAGDDTSTGSAWEAFSLDSLDKAFDDWDQRWSVLGNHDYGGFVAPYLEDAGWKVAAKEVVDGPGGGKLLAWNDPRSSGLGNWRDQPGLSIGEIAYRDRGPRLRLRATRQHRARARRRHGHRGAAPRLRRPGRVRTRARAGRPGPRGRRERQGRLRLHERYDGWCCVRDRRRVEAASPRRGDPGDVRGGRPAGRAPAGDAPDQRDLRGGGLHRAGPRLRGSTRDHHR